MTFAHTGHEGLTRALDSDCEAVILDVMLPGLNGFEVLQRLRASSAILVLMLTAGGEEIDRIADLEVGADDYLPKTFSPHTHGHRLPLGDSVRRAAGLNRGWRRRRWYMISPCVCSR